MIEIDDFLQENKKLPLDNQLSETRIRVLECAKKYADRVYKDNNSWYLEFDEGAYQGKSIIRIHKQKLKPLALLNALDSINWVGHQAIVRECEKLILEILERNS